MMDAVTLMIGCFSLLPSSGFGKPVVTDTASFVLKAPDNDTGIWMWKTANSKVSFRHFHHVGDNADNGHWTLEVMHSETVPKHIPKMKDMTQPEADPKRSHKVREVSPESLRSNFIEKIPYIMLVNAPDAPADVFQEQKRVTTSAFPVGSEIGPKGSHKVGELSPELMSSDSIGRIPYIMLVNAPDTSADEFQEQKRVATPALPMETDKSSSELLEEFLDGTDAGIKQVQESEPQIATGSEESVDETFTQHEGEQDGTEREENWWLPGEDLVDEEEDGYFHVRDIIRVKLYALHKDWNEARRKCRRDGGDLAVPDTVLKARVILKLLRRYPHIPASAVLRNQVYVGIHDPLHHRDWITVKGDGFTEDFWAPGEPDNETPGEDCVTFRTDGKTRDVPCFYSLPFVCEKPLPPSEQYNDRQSYLE